MSAVSLEASTCVMTGSWALTAPLTLGAMAFLLAIGSAVLYGAADFTGGLATRRAGTIPVVNLLSQASGLIMLAPGAPLLSDSSPSRADLLWGVLAGLTGGIGVALLYRALAIGVMAVAADHRRVRRRHSGGGLGGLLGERPGPLAAIGMALGTGSIVLVSQQSWKQNPNAWPHGRATVRRRNRSHQGS